MSFLALKIDDEDISFDSDGRLETTEEKAQSYAVHLGTQFGSDFRDPTYGFKIDEIFQAEREEGITTEDLLRLYATESILGHRLTKNIIELSVDEVSTRRFRVYVRVEIKPDDEVLAFESVIGL